MKTKILISLITLSLVSALLGGIGTYAYFTDIEKSTGNTFTAGTLDLLVDIDGTIYNPLDRPIFSLTDIKPGDHGEKTLSLHVDNNACEFVTVDLTSDLENGCTVPEKQVETDCLTDPDGELNDNIHFTIWNDEGDIQGWQCGNTRACAADPKEGNNIKDGTYENTLVQGTLTEDKAWSIGELKASTVYYYGVAWELPLNVGNIIQSDSFDGDLIIRVDQKRNLYPDGCPTTGTFECTSNAQCDDNNVCTDDVCVNGKCQSSHNTNPCDDGNACTTGDTCSNGICTGTNICGETVCNDGLDNDGDMTTDCEDSDCANEPYCTGALCGDGICGPSENYLTCPADCPSEDIDGDGYTVAQGDCDDSNPTIHPGAVELCNGLDDDCDNIIDDGDPNGGAACNTGQPGVCSAGTQHCQNGALHCVQNIQPSPELCNGLDDDCDGMVDEGDPGGGGACNTGLLGICAAGTIHCQNGALQCVQNVQATTEICNNDLDDDCDGVVDEECLCSPGCYPHWIGDGWCDEVCNNAACNWDGGDCDCSPGCYPHWIGDGWCDSVCNNEACNWDGGDCLP